MNEFNSKGCEGEGFAYYGGMIIFFVDSTRTVAYWVHEKNANITVRHRSGENITEGTCLEFNINQ